MAILRKANLSGKIATWAVEMGEYDIHFQSRAAIKGQVVADFIAEFSKEVPISGGSPRLVEGTTVSGHSPIWNIYMDGSSNNKGSGIGVLLISPYGVVENVL